MLQILLCHLRCQLILLQLIEQDLNVNSTRFSLVGNKISKSGGINNENNDNWKHLEEYFQFDMGSF